MNQALHDVSFFGHYPDVCFLSSLFDKSLCIIDCHFCFQMLDHKSRIWLILFDLHLRHFAKREAQERIKQRYLYEEADLNSKYLSVI